MSEPDRFYVTTPIYYVNDEPHIGHAYTTILADVLSRYHRDIGHETYFLTGVDEHGQKVQQSALKAGIEPQKHCDRMVVHFKEAWKKLEITNDFFIRTTFPFHEKAVRDVLQELYDKGEIYEHEYGGYYCVGCERFYTTKELENGKCPQHLTEPEYIKEKNYFFRMSKYQDWLIDYIKTHRDFIQPQTRCNEVLGFLKKPLEDLCISRPKSRLKWGIELPFDSNYVTYVWFDALLNYVTAIGYKQDDKRFKNWWPADYHLIGKDIVTTHCIYWPTMLKAIGIPMPKTIFAHGWWLSEETKMSKSLKNIVKPLDLIDMYGVDPVRYFLIRDMVLGQDASFSETAFIRRYNSDLANDLGNLASRVMTLIRKNYDSVIPTPNHYGEEEDKVINRAKALPQHTKLLIEKLHLNEAIENIIAFVRLMNKYMEIKAPWHLVKTDKDEAATVLYTASEGLRIAASLLHPVMPHKMQKLLDTLKTDIADNDKHVWGKLKPGTKLDAMPILFPRIVKKKEMPLKETNKMENKTDNLITIQDFAKVNLITANVISAENIEGTDKLLKLIIETGKGERQIVAGIAQHYKPTDIIGKTIVIVANLEPAKIRGTESQGMLLAAEKDNKMVLLTTLSEIESGAEIR